MVRRPPAHWLAALLLLAGPAAAAPEAPIRTVVVKVPEGEPPLPLQRLVEALRSQLVELGIEVQLSTGPADGGAVGGTTSSSPDRDVLAFVWIERTADALTVHFYEPAGTSLRERRVPVTGTDAASIEEVAVVVRSAANALLERAAQEPSPTAEPARPPPPPPPPEAPPREAQPGLSPFQAAVGYAGTRYASEVPWQHGAQVSIAWRAGSTPWRLGAAYTWVTALRRQTEDLTLTLYRHPMEVFVGFEVPVSDGRVSLRAEGAGIADQVVRRTNQVSPDLQSTPSNARWSWAVSTRLRLAWRPTRPVWLFATAGADFLLDRFDHVVRSPEEEPVISPLAVRPNLQVGGAVDFP